MNARLPTRDLAYCGVLGAAALLLPVVFHLLRLGHVFMPMYLPIVTLAFFVRVWPAAVTALVVPLLSAVLTGMPPLYRRSRQSWRWSWRQWRTSLPPSWPGARPPTNGSCWRLLWLNVALVYGVSLLLELPAGFLAGVSFLAGWPGVVLMLLVVPPVVRATRERTPWSAR